VELTGRTALMHHKMSEETIMSLLGPKSKKKVIKEEKLPRQIAEEHAYSSVVWS
jgi:hypothetical protein